MIHYNTLRVMNNISEYNSTCAQESIMNHITEINILKIIYVNIEYIYIYIHVHMCIYRYTYMCIYIHIHTHVLVSVNHGARLGAAHSSIGATATGRRCGDAYSHGSSAHKTHTAEDGSSDL